VQAAPLPSEDLEPFVSDALAQGGPQARADDNVGLPAEDVAQQHPKASMIDDREFAAGLDIHHHVHIAVRPGVAARQRSEQRQMGDAARAQLALVSFEHENGLVASHGASFSEIEAR